jgi:hypothetical protein
LDNQSNGEIVVHIKIHTKTYANIAEIIIVDKNLYLVLGMRYGKVKEFEHGRPGVDKAFTAS